MQQEEFIIFVLLSISETKMRQEKGSAFAVSPFRVRGKQRMYIASFALSSDQTDLGHVS